MKTRLDSVRITPKELRPGTVDPAHLSAALLDAKERSLKRSIARLDRKLGIVPRKPDPCADCQHYSTPSLECRNCYRAVKSDNTKLRRRVLFLERKLNAVMTIPLRARTRG